MDPSSVQSIQENEFMFASNRHLYEWLTEGDQHDAQIQLHYNESDRQYASKQSRVNLNKTKEKDIYDEVDRIFELRSTTNSQFWDEDYLSNETDPQLKLPEDEASIIEPSISESVEVAPSN